MQDKLLNANALRMLQKDWSEAKSNGMTQLDMSKKLGITQPTFSQYLRGTIPLNVSFLVKYAMIRKVPLESVGLTDKISTVQLDRLWLRVDRTTAGVRFKERFIEMSGVVSSSNAYLIEVDSDYRTIPKGAFLVCESLPCVKGSLVVATCKDAFIVGTLAKYDADWFVIEPQVSGDKAHPIDKTWSLQKVTSISFSKDESDAEQF